MREELKVVRIEKIEGAEIGKRVYPSKGYTTQVMYTLEDGRTLPSSMGAGKLKDLKAKLAELPKTVNNIKVTLEHGKIIMSSTTYSIGASGLQERSV